MCDRVRLGDGYYVGPTRNGEPCGRGVWHGDDDTRVEGVFDGCNVIGRGVAVFPVGAQTIRYEGEFGGLTPNGYGVAIFPNGDRYAGTFRRYSPEGADSCPDGNGVLLKQDGTRYVGEFEDEGRGAGQDH